MYDNLAIGFIAGISLLWMQKWHAYGKYVWFDNVAHILGGATVASAAAIFTGGWLPYIITFTVGVLWELFEWYEGIHPWDGDPHDKAWEDTALDMTMAMIGAYGAITAAQYI